MEDATADYFALLSDGQGCLMDGYEPLTAMDEAFIERMTFICRDPARYAVIHRETGRVVGETGLRRMSCAHDRSGPMDEVVFSLTNEEWLKEASSHGRDL